ncbi:MAG: MBL fold metallo-hydrolase [Dehalococcoidia bacterium]|jgi:glyoxylase-like metal-dependent hydrolase (beta-lactamase superfamily II)|nr:MBL fold metallo-hydrolase [Dehalococcoidia bacterium]MDP7469996.1 MBL fold metallo-hydrolase [Dehalococcoidia bacterium]
MEIIPGIHQIKVPIPDNPLGFLNCYVLKGKSGWLMIDTGWYTQDAFNALEAGLKGMGLNFSDIETIVVTHVHADHYGLAGRIKQVSPSTKLMTHRWEGDLIESRYIKFAELRDKMGAVLALHGVPQVDLDSLQSASMPVLEYVSVTMPDVSLYGGEVLSTGIFNLEVLWTPGHSPGHICLWESEHRILFSGDHILPEITPNISFHVQSGDSPLADFINSLNKLRNLPATQVLPAHENIFANLRERIDQIKEHHEQRKEEIRGVIRQEPQNAWFISSQITWNIPQPWDQFNSLDRRIAVTETIAHLEYMRWEGSVERLLQDGIIVYRVAS